MTSHPTVLAQLAELSSAEDFFEFLDVDYDRTVLNVCRLHIMQRMGEYIRQDDLAGMRDDEVRAVARRHLARAYGDFVASSPAEEKVFKILAASAAARAGIFISLADLVASLDDDDAAIAN